MICAWAAATPSRRGFTTGQIGGIIQASSPGARDLLNVLDTIGKAGAGFSRDQQREALAQREAGEPLTDIARTFGVSHTTIGRLR